MEIYYSIAPVGFMTIDRHMVVTDVNSYFLTLSGYTIQDILDKPLFHIIQPGQLQTISDLYVDADTGKPFFRRLTFIHSQGMEVFTRCTILPCHEYSQFRIAVEDISEQQRAEEQLIMLTQKLRDLAGHIEAGMEKERKRLAREIHDGIGSALSAINMELSVLGKNISSGRTGKAITNQIQNMAHLVERSIDLVRNVATQLRPEVLDELGLIATLKWYSKEFENRTGILTGYIVFPKDFEIGTEISTAVFRIFQEIMNNISKHAAASKVTIFLRKQPHQLFLRVRDNGIGINESESSDRKSFGIIGMNERVKLLHGQMHITGIPGNGTTVEIEIPLSTDIH